MRYSCLGSAEEHVSHIAIAKVYNILTASVIARAVAGLLHHLEALSPDTRDFDTAFFEGLNLYRTARTRDELQKNTVCTLLQAVLVKLADSFLKLHWFR